MKDESLIFFRMIRDFLNIYLLKQKASSKNTIKSYKAALNLLVDYTKNKLEITISDISFSIITREHLETFLEWIEDSRGCSVSTRNQRLACIKSFYKYASGRDITIIAYRQELSMIPIKKETKKYELKYFNEEVLKVIFRQANLKKKKGIRNLFFMILMYDTAARNQEMLDLRLIDIHASEKNPYVILTGKGNKTRLVPIMKKTVDHFENYKKIFHQCSTNDSFLFYTFRNGDQSQMSPDNTEKFIKKYGVLARQENDDVPPNIHPHMFRHSRSMHLYRGGMPLVLLSEWLGHASLETTWIYANADTLMKREAIEKATSKINPLKMKSKIIDFNNDEEMIKKLYGLI